MCDFLTISVPITAAPRLSTWQRQGFELSRSSDSSIQTHLPPGYEQWLLTSGGCSCDLVKHVKSTPGLIALRADVPEILNELLGADGAGFILVRCYNGETVAGTSEVGAADSMTLAGFRHGSHCFAYDQLIPVVRQAPEPNQTLRQLAAKPRSLATRALRRSRRR